MREGSLGDVASLGAALGGVSHVIHCAGATKARRASDFDGVNRVGTRNLVQAVNTSAGVQRLVHVSSLAAAGPSALCRPRREMDPPQPVSAYGKSKLAAEREVSEACRADFVILRPPSVYGPRDQEFLRLFKAVKRHLLPQPTARQELSLVYVKDLATCAVNCLEDRDVSRQTFFVAAREIITAGLMAREIAAQMRVWTIPMPLPVFGLWIGCLIQQLLTWLTGKPNVLSLQKFAELRASAWTCDPARSEAASGLACPTRFKEGASQTLSWYREHQWL